nr:hypothetical protein [uncultured Desulfuromonas sp.]
MHPFERQVKRVSPAGANPGDLDFDLAFLWFAFWNHLRWQRATVFNVGTHMTRASALKQVADDHRGDRSLRSVLLNGRAWVLNNRQPKGGHRPTRLIGATPEIKKDKRVLSTFYAKADEAHDSPS